MLWEDGEVEAVLAGLRGGRAAWVDAFQEARAIVSVGLGRGRLERGFSGAEVGAGVRVVGPDGIGYASTNVGSISSLRDAARAAASALGAGSGLVHLETDAPTRPLDDPLRDATWVDEQILREVDDAARSYSPLVVDVSGRMTLEVQRVRIASSDRPVVGEARATLLIVLVVVAAREGRVAWGYEAFGCAGERWVGASPAEMGARVAAEAVSKLDARPARGGKGSVVLGHGSGGIFVHEALGHGLEGDSYGQESTYSGMLGRAVAPEGFDVFDDPTLEGGVARFGIDDDGTAAQRTPLVADGTLAGVLTDRVTADRLTRPSSGSARRESFEFLPQPRMSNLVVGRGRDDPAEIVRSVRRGVFVSKLTGGQVNPTTGRFVFSILEGYEIDGGEIGGSLESATLLGSAPDDLRAIAAVGTDTTDVASSCTKNGQTVLVGSRCPTLLLDDVHLGGTA